MKNLKTSKGQREQGGALIVTAIIAVVVCGVLTSCLLATQNEFATVNRSQTWNATIALTEAGVEDAFAFMNKYSGNVAMVPKWSTAASAQEDGWTVNGNFYTMHRVVDPSVGSYDVTIDNTISNSPVVTCVGVVASGASASAWAPGYMFAAIGAPGMSAPPATRKVQVRSTYSAIFPGAITTRTNIDLNGNQIRVDSFDSAITNYSVWKTNWGYGVYDISKARANGDVATCSSVVGAISIGQANIYGHLDTGPGGAATIGNNGYVGPLPQSGSGIKPGYAKDDMNIIFPDVVLPNGAATWTVVPSSNLITNSGNYVIYGIYNNLTIAAKGVSIYVNGPISLSGWQSITVATNGADVSIYVAGPSISLTGNASINNLTQNAHNFGIYGLPTVTSISFAGNADFTGTIYAPEANFSFGGGGSDTYDYVGSLVANSCKLNGKSQFHYDESLKRNGPGIGYIPASWQEITGNN